MRKLPDYNRLHDLFVYDPESGFVYKKVGHNNPDGYVYLYVDGHQYSAHRIIWKMEKGKDPEGIVDHKNGITSDNRIENLRDISLSENAKNNKSVRRKTKSKKSQEEELIYVNEWKERLKAKEAGS